MTSFGDMSLPEEVDEVNEDDMDAIPLDWTGKGIRGIWEKEGGERGEGKKG